MSIPHPPQVQSRRFPTIGTKNAPFSKHWKNFGRFFQGLEKYRAMFTFLVFVGFSIQVMADGGYLNVKYNTPSSAWTASAPTLYAGDWLEVEVWLWYQNDPGLGGQLKYTINNWGTALYDSLARGQVDGNNARYSNQGSSVGPWASGTTVKMQIQAWYDWQVDLFSPVLESTVLALNTPAFTSATKDATYPSTRIDLSWSKNAQNHDVMIVRSTDSSFTDPTQGTGYTAGSSDIGGDPVIYKGSATTYEDTGLTANTHYYYKIYSENNNYYSTGVTDDETTDPITWDGGDVDDNNWTSGDNWAGNSAPTAGEGTDLSFDGSTRTSPYNNFSDWSKFRTITFNSGADAFTLTGNSIDWYGDIVNNSANEQTINLSNLSMKKAGGGSITASAGDITLGGGNNIWNDNTDILHIYGDGGHTVTLGKTLAGNDSGAGITIHDNTILDVTVSQTFDGPIDVQDGKLVASHDSALGDVSGGVTVADGAALELSGVRTIGAEALTLSGTGISSGGALRNTSGNDTYAGAITLAAATRINSDSDTLTLDVASGNAISGAYNLTLGGDGDITVNDPVATGTGTLTKDGSGTLTLSAANTYEGATLISAGVLSAQHATALGTVAGGVTVASGAALEIEGSITIGAEALTLNGSGVSENGALRNTGDSNSFDGAITLGSDAEIQVDANTLNLGGGLSLGAYTLTVQVDGTALDMDAGELSGTKTTGGGAITKTGTGRLELRPASGLTGSVFLNAGAIYQSTGNSSTLPAGGLLVLADETTYRSDGTTDRVVAKNIRIDGDVTLGHTSADLNNGQLTLSGSMDLNSAVRTITIPNNNTISGEISNGGLIKDGAGTLILSGDNTYESATTISEGTLQVGDGGTTGDIHDNSDITIASGAALVWDRSDAESYGGDIDGAGTLTVQGGGTLTLSGTSTFSGTTTLSEGGLVVSGSSSASAISVASGAKLSGAGAVEDLTLGGEVDPGDSDNARATLTCGAVSLVDGGSMRLDISAVAGSAGTGWDLLASSGAVTVNGTGTFTIYLDDQGASGFSSSTVYNWKFFDGSSAAVSFDGARFAVNTDDFSPGLGGGEFSVTESSGDLFLTFTPASNPANINTPTVTDIATTTATLGATLTDNGGQSVTDYGIVWGTSTGPTTAGNKIQEGTSDPSFPDIFTVSATGLPAGTLVYYRGYAINSVDTAYSAEDTFYTLSTEPDAQVTSLFADIYAGTGTTQLELQWTELATADGYIILRSETASPTGVPVDATGYSATDVLGNGTVAAVIAAGSTTNFNDTGLTADTQYFYAIFPFAYDGANAATYNYKTDGTVATDDTYTLASGPSGEATIDSDGSTYTSITVNWTKGANSTDTLVIVSDGAIGAAPTDRNSYTASTVYGAGTEIGTDEFVAYAGSAATVTITGLNPGTTYYVKLFPYNGSDPVSYNYRTTSPAAGTVDTTARPTEATWDSEGADDNMKTSANWDTDIYPASGAATVLNFGTGARTTPNNDYDAGTTFGTIDFNAAAPAFTLDGNAMDLAINIVNNSGNEQTVDLDIDIVAASDLEVDANTEAIILGGVISGSSKGIKKTGANDVTLTGANDYTGDTSIEEGNIVLSGSGTLGASAGGINLGLDAANTLNAKLQFADAGHTVANDLVVGDSDGTATRTIASYNTSGQNTISGGITHNNAGDKLNFYTDDTASLIEVSGDISGAANILMLDTGSGTVKLSGDNASFSGAIFMDAGTLDLAHSSAAGSGQVEIGKGASGGTPAAAILKLSAAGLTVANNLLVNDEVSQTRKILADYSGSSELSGDINLEESLAIEVTSGTTLDLSGAIDMGFESSDDSVNLTGAGDLTLSGTMSAVTGTSELNHNGSGTLSLTGVMDKDFKLNIGGGGTVYLEDADSLGEPSGTYVDKVNFVSSGGTLYNDASINLVANVGMNINDGVTGTFQVGDGSGDTLTINGVIADGGSNNGQLTKTGPGVLYLLGANTFGGALTINNGTVRVAADSGLGSAPASETDGQLTINGGTLLCATTFTLNANRNIALGASGGTLSALSSQTLTIASKIKGSGDLIVSGAGDVELSGINTFSGTTTISDGGANGDLKVAADSAFGADPGTPTAGSITIDGGSLQATSTFELDSDRGVAIGAGDATIKVDGSQTLTYAGIISGAGNALTKAGAGTLVLTGANDYSGGTTVSAGTLKGNVAGLQGNITLADGTVLEFAESGTGTFSDDITDGADDGAVTFSGAGAVTVSGGTVSYSGNTTISNGKVFYNVDNASTPVTVSSGIFGGDGTVGALVVSGRVHPGSADDAIGKLDCSALTLNAGGSYRWEISDVDAGAGSGHDFIDVDTGSGTINADATSGSPFTIFVTGNPADWDGSADYTWVIAQGATVNGHNADEFSFDFSGFTPSEEDGIWSVAVDSGDLVINYVALASQPTTQAASLEITAVDSTTMSLAWSRGNGDKVLIVAREDSAAEDPSDGATYTANAAWGSAGTVGAASKAVYQDTGTSEDLTGLTAETLYHFAAYEFSGAGGAENYLLTDAPVVSGYTLSTEPAGHAGSFTADNPTSSSIDLSWTAGTGPLDGYIILKREGTDPTSTPTDGQAYTVGNTLSDGSVVAALVSGTSQTISALTAETEYHFSIIPYNWDGAHAATYNYYTDATIPTANDTTEALTIIKDQFDSNDSGYSVDANLNGLNGGTGWSGAWSVTTAGDTGSKVVQIVTGSKTVPDGYPESVGNKIQMSPANATNDTFKAKRSFTAFTSGKIYAAGLLSFAANGTDRYIGLSLMDDSTEKAFLGVAKGEGEVLSLASYAASGDPINSSKVFYGNNDKSYLVIVRYDFATEEISSLIYWAGVDTVPTQEPATWDLNDIDISGRIGANGIDGIQITAGGIGNSFQFDEIRVTDSWGALFGQSSSPGELAPTVQASDLLFSAVQTDAFTIDLTGGNGVGTLVVAREGAAVAWTPTDGETYTANSVFESGESLGDNTYVIYNDSDDNPNINLSNLSPDTVYYIQAFEYNSAAGTKYLTSEVSGNPASQSTLGAPAPVVGLSGTTAVDLNWTRFNDTHKDYNVLVAYRANSAVTFTPTDGVDYSTGAQGSDTILIANSSDTYYNHTGLTEDDVMHYRFFTRNGNYYSAGVDVQVTLTETSLTVYDGFEKSSGDLDQAGAGGTGWSGDWSLNDSGFADFEASSLSVLSAAQAQHNKGLFYGDVYGRFIDATRSISSPINSGTIYLSWLQQHQYGGSENYAGLRILNSSGDVEAFIGKRYSDSLQIAEYGDAKSASTSLDAGANYLLVARIQFNASGTDEIIKVAAYKNNTDLLGEEPATWALTVTTQVDNVGKIRLSCGANGGNKIGVVRYDEIRIGDSWTEVVRYEGQQYKQMMEAGPTPELIFVGDVYTPGTSPLKNSITDAELNDGAAEIDIAVRWSSAQGVFMTNTTTSLNSETSDPKGTISTVGNVVPNWDPLTRNEGGDTALGFDKAFTGFVGNNGDLVVTSYYADAFTGTDFDGWQVGDEFFVSVSGQTLPSSGAKVNAPSGGDQVPDRRAFTINSNLAFQVVDDDPDAPLVAGFDEDNHTDEEMLAGLELAGQVLDSGSGVDASSLTFTLKNGIDGTVGSADTDFTTRPASDGAAKTDWENLSYTIAAVTKEQNSLGTWSIDVNAADVDDDGWVGDASSATTSFTFDVTDDDAVAPVNLKEGSPLAATAITDADVNAGDWTLTLTEVVKDVYSGIRATAGEGGAAPTFSIQNNIGTTIIENEAFSEAPTTTPDTSVTLEDTSVGSVASKDDIDLGTYEVTVTVYDNDSDRTTDALGLTDALVAEITVTDDDTADPEIASNKGIDNSLEARPLNVTLGAASKYTSGDTTERIYTVTDGELAALTDEAPLRMIFGARDVHSGILRGAGGMNITIGDGDVVSDNTAAFSVADSSSGGAANSGAGYSTNVWTWGTSAFSAANIQDLFLGDGVNGANTNVVTANLVDSDDDRTGDSLSVADQQYGYLVVHDDDTAGPAVSGMGITGGGVAGAILETSFEADEGWSTHAYTDNDWTDTNDSGTWYGHTNSVYNNSSDARTGSKSLLMNAEGQWLQLPLVSDPGQLTIYAKCSGSEDLAVEYRSGDEWISVGTKTIANATYTGYSWDLDLLQHNVTVRVVRVSAAGNTIFTDDYSLTPYGDRWLSTDAVTVTWNESSDVSGIFEYRRSTDLDNENVPPVAIEAETSMGTTRTYEYTGLGEGVFTGFIFAVDADSDRGSGYTDRARGENGGFIARLDRTAPPAPAAAPTLAEGPDPSTEISASWIACANAGIRAGDGDPLSPWETYKVYYTTGESINTNTDPYITVANGPGSLDKITTSSATFSNFVFGETYRIAIAGVDEAGNEGSPSAISDPIVMTGFNVTQGVAEVSSIVTDGDAHLSWTAHFSDGSVDREYDLLYVDSSNFADGLSNQWALVDTVEQSYDIDDGTGSGTKPGNLTEHTLRFYRAAPKDTWKSERNPRSASEEVYVLQNIYLREGQNWVSLAGIPDNNTAAYVLGNNLPSDGTFINSTKVSWYDRTSTQSANKEIWYDSNSGTWQYSVGGSGDADEATLPAEQGFIIEISSGEGVQKLQAIGRVPTETMEQTLYADAYNLVSFRTPRAVHPSEMNLLAAGFRGGTSIFDVFFGGADTMWKWNREEQSIPNTGEMIWYDTGSSTWRFSKSPYSAVPAGYFKPDDAIIIYRKGAVSDLTWTNALLYTPPTRLMNP